MILIGLTWIMNTTKSPQSCPTLCDPIDGSPPDSPSLGFSRQEHWSRLPFPSPMHESEKWKGSRSVVSDSSDPMDCSLPGSSIHGIFQAKVLEWGAIAFSKFINYLKFGICFDCEWKQPTTRELAVLIPWHPQNDRWFYIAFLSLWVFQKVTCTHHFFKVKWLLDLPQDPIT